MSAEILESAYTALAEAEDFLRASNQLGGWDRDETLTEVESQIHLAYYFAKQLVPSIEFDENLTYEQQIDHVYDCLFGLEDG